MSLKLTFPVPMFLELFHNGKLRAKIEAFLTGALAGVGWGDYQFARIHVGDEEGVQTVFIEFEKGEGLVYRHDALLETVKLLEGTAEPQKLLKAVADIYVDPLASYLVPYKDGAPVKAVSRIDPFRDEIVVYKTDEEGKIVCEEGGTVPITKKLSEVVDVIYLSRIVQTNKEIEAAMRAMWGEWLEYEPEEEG